MTQLEQIASLYRVRLRRDACSDPIIGGKNGHLYSDHQAILACFTDDGRKRPFPTKLFKTRRLAKLRPFLVRLQLEGDFEFIAQIQNTPQAIATALFEVLQVRRFKVTKGVSRPVSPQFAAARDARNRQHAGKKATLEL